LITKRVMDILLSFIGILLFCIPAVLMALWIKLDSKGPVFFRQIRVGLHGKEFKIFKFRTMICDAEKQGLQLTVGVDSRVSRVGRTLRRFKLDELPQLVNVFVGNMSLVGPRPEVPRYVTLYPSEVKDLVLSVRPGITDLASIFFRNESEILAKSNDPENTYIKTIIPIKLDYYSRYVRERTLLLDLRIVATTLLAVCRR
jgi:lipopolysaccharide/colanic/teichoic acid biosynthesis glycosyltransferase